METRALAQRVLARAAARIGGADRLAKHLAVEPATLEIWLQGGQVPPVEAILKAVDLVIDERSSFIS
jgi:DNA-binding transcriptional regulator YdaS (Cro superfamily)